VRFSSSSASGSEGLAERSVRATEHHLLVFLAVELASALDGQNVILEGDLEIVLFYAGNVAKDEHFVSLVRTSMAGSNVRVFTAAMSASQGAGFAMRYKTLLGLTNTQSRVIAKPALNDGIGRSATSSSTPVARLIRISCS
jgi:hypothetical protein